MSGSWSGGGIGRRQPRRDTVRTFLVELAVFLGIVIVVLAASVISWSGQ